MTYGETKIAPRNSFQEIKDQPTLGNVQVLNTNNRFNTDIQRYRSREGNNNIKDIAWHKSTKGICHQI